MATPESAALAALLRHHALILEAFQRRLELKGFTSEEEHLAQTVKEVWWIYRHCFRDFRVDAGLPHS